MLKFDGMHFMRRIALLMGPRSLFACIRLASSECCVSNNAGLENARLQKIKGALAAKESNNHHQLLSLLSSPSSKPAKYKKRK